MNERRILRQFCGMFALLLLLSVAGKVDAEPGLADQPEAGCPTGTTAVPLPLSLQVALQRPNSPPPDPAWAVPVHFALYPPGDDSVICHEWDLTLDQNGEYVPAGVGDYLTLFTGTYDARIRNLHTLRNVKRNVSITGPMTIDMGELREGDADADNRVRSSDFAILSAAYFTNEGDAGFDPRADFDEDDRIRSSDFALLSGNYFLTGDLEVTTTRTVAQQAGVRGLVDVALEPAQITVVPGAVLTLTMVAHAGDQPFVAMDADIRFPPESLEVVDESGLPASAIEPLPPLPGQYNVVNNTTGRILYLAGALPSIEVSGDVALAQIRFRAKAETSGAVVDLADVTVSDIGGKFVHGQFTGALVRVSSEGSLRRLYLPILLF